MTKLPLSKEKETRKQWTVSQLFFTFLLLLLFLVGFISVYLHLCGNLDDTTTPHTKEKAKDVEVKQAANENQNKKGHLSNSTASFLFLDEENTAYIDYNDNKKVDKYRSREVGLMERVNEIKGEVEEGAWQQVDRKEGVQQSKEEEKGKSESEMDQEGPTENENKDENESEREDIKNNKQGVLYRGKKKTKSTKFPSKFRFIKRYSTSFKEQEEMIHGQVPNQVKRNGRKSQNPNYNNSNEIHQSQSVLSLTRTTCYPMTDLEAEQALLSSECSIIVLGRKKQKEESQRFLSSAPVSVSAEWSDDDPYAYRINQEIEITSPKTVIGHPIHMPSLITNNKNMQRLFRIRSTGRLDLRYIKAYSGFAVTRDAAFPRPRTEKISLRIGSCIRVDPDGFFFALGVLFLNHPQTLESYISGLENPKLERTFGGTIFNFGGKIETILCVFLGYSPYGDSNTNVLRVGTNILSLSGHNFQLGTAYVSYDFWSMRMEVGAWVALFGGIMISAGSGVYTCNPFQANYGAGLIVFNAGGLFQKYGDYRLASYLFLYRAAYGLFTNAAGGTYSLQGFWQEEVLFIRCYTMVCSSTSIAISIIFVFIVYYYVYLYIYICLFFIVIYS